MNGTDLPGVPSRPWDDLNEQFEKLQASDKKLLEEERKKQREAVIDKTTVSDVAVQTGKTREDIKNEMVLMNMVRTVKAKRDPLTGEIKEHSVIDTQKLALLLSEKYSSVSVAGSRGSVVWLWNGKNYQKDMGTIHRDITHVASLFQAQAQRSLVSEVTSMLQGTSFFDKTPFNYKEGWLPVDNGMVVLDFKDETIRHYPNHEPALMTTYCLPVNYDPDAPTEPVLEVLRSWVPEDDVQTLIQIPAQGFIQAQFDRTFKKSYLLQGEPNSGKSTYAGGNGLLNRFCGDDCGVMSQVSLHKITNNEFSLSELENRVINCYDDLNSEELRNYGIFKNITGATHHSIDVKHQSSYSGRIYCVHVFTCNIPPRVPDIVMVEPAFWNRWEFINFPNEYEVDPGWADRTFTPEFMSGFLNLVIKEMFRIVREGKIRVVHDADEVRERWSLAMDPLKQFIEDKTTDEDTYGKPVIKRSNYDKNKLFKEYNEYFNENKFDERKKIKTIDGFSKRIQVFGFIPDKASIKSPDGKRSMRVPVFSACRIWREGQACVQPDFPSIQ